MLEEKEGEEEVESRINENLLVRVFTGRGLPISVSVFELCMYRHCSATETQNFYFAFENIGERRTSS